MADNIKHAGPTVLTFMTSCSQLDFSQRVEFGEYATCFVDELVRSNVGLGFIEEIATLVDD